MANDEAMKVDQRLARLEVTVAREFQAIGKNFRDVQKRFDEIDERFDKLERLITESRTEHLNGLSALHKRLDFLRVPPASH